MKGREHRNRDEGDISDVELVHPCGIQESTVAPRGKGDELQIAFLAITNCLF